MTLYFCDQIENIPELENNTFLYLFLSKPQPSEDLAYIKIGITKNNITKRLKQYINKKSLETSIIPTNIYYIQTSKVYERELLIKNLYNLHSDINLYNGNEYFKGTIKTMINIFAYITLSEESNLNYIKNQYDNQNKQIFEVIDSYKYDIIKITQEKEYIDYSYKENFEDIENNIMNICNFCNITLKNKAGLSIHIKYCKDNPNGIIVNNKVCKYCNKEFSSIANLNFHFDEKHCPEYTKYIEKELDKYKSENEIINKNYELIKTKYEKDIERYINENNILISNYTEKKLESDNYKKESKYYEIVTEIKTKKVEELEKKVEELQEKVEKLEEKIYKIKIICN
jgi:hypothetical protein